MKAIFEYYQFNDNQIKIIEELEGLGWQFEEDEWQDGHNGNDYYNFRGKSPRLDEFINFNENFKSLQDLFRRECEFLSYTLVQKYISAIENMYNERIYKELLELPINAKYKFKL